MSDDEDPWGEEPPWARDEEQYYEHDRNEGSGSDDDGNRQNKDSDYSGRTYIKRNFEFAAQHIVVLIDSHPQMFIPCVRILSRDAKDEYGEGDRNGESDANEDGVDGKKREIFINESISSKNDSIQKGNLDRRRFNDNTNNHDDDGLITPFDAALMACEKLIHLRVHYVATSKSGKRDGVGVLLYGITKSRSKKLKRGVIDTKDGAPNDNSNRNHYGNSIGINDDSDNITDNSSDGDSGSNTGIDEDDDECSFLSARSIHNLVPLSPPGTRQIKQIRSCLPSANFNKNGSIHSYGDVNFNGIGCRYHRMRDLKEEFVDMSAHKICSDGLCSLRSALYEATRSFLNAKCVKNHSATSQNPSDSRTIWIFTNQDDPCYGNEREKEQVIIVAKDAVDNGLDIHVWPLPYSKSINTTPFNTSIFFDHIITNKNNNWSSLISSSLLSYSANSKQSMPKGFQSERIDIDRTDFTEMYLDLDEIMDQIMVQWKKVRSTQTIPLLFPDWKDRPDCPGIMLDIFSIIKVKRKPMHVTVHQETNKMTNQTTQVLGSESGKIVTKDQIQTFFEFGGERVPMSPTEVAKLRISSNSNPNQACLILSGFKLLSSSSMTILLSQLIDKSLFAYPNDNVVKGSKVAFASLHTSMLRKRVMGIGEYLSRVNTTSRIVAILPQQEERVIEECERCDELVQLSKQVVPPGFILIPLPYEDDIRAIPEDSGYIAGEEEIEAAMNLVRNQNIQDGIAIGESFENPALRKFWNYIESVALDTPLEDDDEDDDTKMNVDGILCSAGEQIEALKKVLPEDDVVALPKKERKRKIADIVPDQTGIDWVHYYELDNLMKCKVDELKAYLRSFGEVVGGRKVELVDRIKHHIEKRKANEEI